MSASKMTRRLCGAGSPEVAHAATSNPPNQCSRTPPDVCGRLHTPPMRRPKLAEERATAPVSSSASHVSRRWRKCGRPLPSRRHPGASHRGDGSPLRGRRGACTAPQAAVSLRRPSYGAPQQFAGTLKDNQINGTTPTSTSSPNRRRGYETTEAHIISS